MNFVEGSPTSSVIEMNAGAPVNNSTRFSLFSNSNQERKKFENTNFKTLPSSAYDKDNLLLKFLSDENFPESFKDFLV